MYCLGTRTPQRSREPGAAAQAGPGLGQHRAHRQGLGLRRGRRHQGELWRLDRDRPGWDEEADEEAGQKSLPILAEVAAGTSDVFYRRESGDIVARYCEAPATEREDVKAWNQKKNDGGSFSLLQTPRKLVSNDADWSCYDDVAYASAKYATSSPDKYELIAVCVQTTAQARAQKACPGGGGGGHECATWRVLPARSPSPPLLPRRPTPPPLPPPAKGQLRFLLVQLLRRPSPTCLNGTCARRRKVGRA